MPDVDCQGLIHLAENLQVKEKGLIPSSEHSSTKFHDLNSFIITEELEIVKMFCRIKTTPMIKHEIIKSWNQHTYKLLNEYYECQYQR